MSFSSDAWARNAALYEKTRDMPFNQELASGQLDENAFKHYMIQDAHYLVAFGRALAIASAKADDADGVVQFADAAKGAVVAERTLHAGFLKQFGIDDATFEATPLTPACHHYTSFLIATAWSVPYPVALAALLPWELTRRLDAELPEHLEVPSGSHVRVDYAAEGGPVLAVKLQEMFGARETPRVARGRVPVVMHLLSPAGRPLQVTRDLAGFWRTGYPAVRAEMRGRYPKHPWPENPLAAPPTRLTTRRMQQAAAGDATPQNGGHGGGKAGGRSR